MKHTLIIGRREFTLEAVLMLLSGTIITVSGCGGGGDSYSTPSSPSPTPVPEPGSSVGVVSANHGHNAAIAGAHITVGNAVQLDIRGTANHPHSVTLSSDAVQAIGAGNPVFTNSTTNASSTAGTHLHAVRFNPDTPGDPVEY